MQSLVTAVHNASKINGFLQQLYGGTARVSIGLIGDSTTQYQGHGWDSGVVLALNSQNLQRFGTGLIGTGENTAIGHGANQDTLSNNASPSTTADAGFTASLPVAWHSLVTNRGSGSATTDATRTYMGALRPFVVTASNLSNTTFGFAVHGSNVASHSRPFERLASDLVFQHWYLVTDAVVNGRATTVAARKSSNQDQTQVVNINNYLSSAGGTFQLQLGLTTTAAITYSSNSTTFASNIRTALHASFPGLTATVSVSESGSNLFSGDAAISIGIGGNYAGTNLPLASVTGSSLTSQYQGNGYSGSTVFVETYGASAGGFFTPVRTGSTLTAGSQTLDGSATQYMRRLDFAIGASAGRDYTTVFMPFNAGASGPWCSMFSAAAVSGATNGYASTVMLYLGSRGARTHAVTLQNQSNEFLTNVLQGMAEHAGYTNAASAPLLIRVHGGVNDRPSTGYEAGTTSVGPNAGLSSDTASGLADNWQAIINRFNAVYSANGWNNSNLYWLFVASPPQEYNDSSLDFARQAAVQVSNNNDRVAAVNMFLLTQGFTADTKGLAGRSDNSDTLDLSHFSYTGFRIYSQAEWDSVQAAYNYYNSSQIVGSSNPSSVSGVWFAGKIYTPDQYRKILESFYPNLIV